MAFQKKSERILGGKFNKPGLLLFTFRIFMESRVIRRENLSALIKTHALSLPRFILCKALARETLPTRSD